MGTEGRVKEKPYRSGQGHAFAVGHGSRHQITSSSRSSQQVRPFSFAQDQNEEEKDAKRMGSREQNIVNEKIANNTRT